MRYDSGNPSEVRINFAPWVVAPNTGPDTIDRPPDIQKKTTVAAGNVAVGQTLDKAHAAFKKAIADASDPELAWKMNALCQFLDEPDLFFPENGQNPEAAKRVCIQCEVRTDCLQYALGRDEHHGVWGGLSQRQLNKIRRRGGSAPTKQ